MQPHVLCVPPSCQPLALVKKCPCHTLPSEFLVHRHVAQVQSPWSVGREGWWKQGFHLSHADGYTSDQFPCAAVFRNQAGPLSLEPQSFCLSLPPRTFELRTSKCTSRPCHGHPELRNFTFRSLQLRPYRRFSLPSRCTCEHVLQIFFHLQSSPVRHGLRQSLEGFQPQFGFLGEGFGAHASCFARLLACASTHAVRFRAHLGSSTTRCALRFACQSPRPRRTFSPSSTASGSGSAKSATSVPSFRGVEIASRGGTLLRVCLPIEPEAFPFKSPFERKLVGSAVPSPRTLSGSFFSLLNRIRYGSVRELRGENVVRGRRGGEEEVNSSHLTAAAGPNCAGTKRGWRQRLRRAFLPPQVRFRRFGGGRKMYEIVRKRMS